MIVNTPWLFSRLLSTLSVDAVADIGSMDGKDALRFRARAPAATIFAFEASPGNFSHMQANPVLRSQRIELLPLAVTNYDGEAEFFVTPEGYSEGACWRGMSSLHRRSDQPERLIPTRVKAARLDTVLAGRLLPETRLALWIDTEGKAFEVIDGAAGILDRVWVVHVEVETQPCIAPDQKCYPEVQSLMEGKGFVEIAVDRAPQSGQCNALFVRNDLPPAMMQWIRIWRGAARVRRLLEAIVHGVFSV